jgi:hypothetical protein
MQKKCLLMIGKLVKCERHCHIIIGMGLNTVKSFNFVVGNLKFID